MDWSIGTQSLLSSRGRPCLLADIIKEYPDPPNGMKVVVSRKAVMLVKSSLPLILSSRLRDYEASRDAGLALGSWFSQDSVVV